MKYIINPMDINTNVDDTYCSIVCLCYGELINPCTSKCDALCTSDCSGTDSVNSPSSFNF